MLEAYGAKLVYFSPLNGEKVPFEADGLYLGGGFPEEFAEELAENEISKDSIRMAISSVIQTLAECGGFMYLTESITNTAWQYVFNGWRHSRKSERCKKNLAALGYREIVGTKDKFFNWSGSTSKRS